MSLPLVKVKSIPVSEELSPHTEEGGRASRRPGRSRRGSRGSWEAEAPPSQPSHGKMMSEFQRLNKYVPCDLNPLGTENIQSEIKIVHPLHC